MVQVRFEKATLQGCLTSGSHDMTTTGTTGLITLNSEINLTLFDDAPRIPTLKAPADGGSDVLLDITLE